MPGDNTSVVVERPAEFDVIDIDQHRVTTGSLDTHLGRGGDDGAACTVSAEGKDRCRLPATTDERDERSGAEFERFAERFPSDGHVVNVARIDWTATCRRLAGVLRRSGEPGSHLCGVSLCSS